MYALREKTAGTTVGAFYQGVNDRPVPSVCDIPLLVRRGGCASKKMLRSLLSGADGVVTREVVSRLTTASAPTNEASRHLLDVASTPPHEEGNFPLRLQLSAYRLARVG